MTEAEWNTCTDPQIMLSLLRGKASERKLRLCACGSFRKHLRDESHALNGILATAERYADHDCTWNELSASRKRADGLIEDAMLGRLPGFGAGFIRDLKAVAHPDVNEALRNTSLDLDVLRDIFGNPFGPVTINPAWRTPTITSIAQGIYDERVFDRLPILADALEEAGCTNHDVLNHCRQAGEHVRGCWVVDLLLGKE